MSGDRPRFNHSSATYLTKSLYLSKPQFPCVENGANNNNSFFQGLWGELNMWKVLSIVLGSK